MDVYEEQTYEAILQRMLDRIPSSIDKREGSVIYDAMAPAAIELAQMYAELDVQLSLRFPDTASGEYLDRSVAWSGIVRKQATSARLKGLFWGADETPIDVSLGSRFSVGENDYVVASLIEKGQYVLECTLPGSRGNHYSGILLPVDYVRGLVRAEIAELLQPGEDTESDASLYDRYQEKITKPITSANKYQYELWAREIAGVGKAKAFPLWNGPGTVKVVLLDNQMRSPATGVIQEVQRYIDPTQDGKGTGTAPIGPVITVAGAEEMPIDVEVQVTLADLEGATVESVKALIEVGVREYLEKLAFEDPLVRYTRISNVILDIPPVIDYTHLKVNGLVSENIQIADGQVAVLGTVTVT